MRLARQLRWSICLLGFAGVVHAAAPTPEWKDNKGATFRGEPVEALGPLLLFRTGAVSSRFLPMRALPPEDCVRFYQLIAGRPPRATRWSDARGQASGEMVGRLQRADKGQLRAAEFAGLPEPELLFVLYGGRRNPDAAAPHFLLDNLAPFINRVQRVYPGRVAAVVWANRESRLNVKALPGATTWLVADAEKQSAMKVVSRFAPGAGFVMVLMTREGVPLLGGPANDVGEVIKFVDSASDILWQLNPANPRSAGDRLHYLRATRPIEFAQRRGEPVLLIDPLRTDALRRWGVTRIEASFQIGPDGAVGEVELSPVAEIPPPLAAPLQEALRRNAIFLPAIDRGAPVAGTYAYSLKIDSMDPKLAADAAWVKGDARVDVPFKSWLVLKPVHVPEQVFSTVDRVGEDGTVMLKAVTAGSANKVSAESQMNSFHSDWFTPAGGPAAVRPNTGDRQEVDGEKLVWKRVTPDHGLVDFLGSAGVGSLDYCIGYAWTEFDVPEETEAWLGIGSDDGLKVWHGNELVINRWIARTSRLDDDVVPLRLTKGRNQFLIKIQNVKGLWSFTCRLRVRAAGP